VPPGVVEHHRPLDATQRLGRRRQQPVVGPDEQAGRRLHEHRPAGGADARVDDRDVDAHRQVRHGLCEHGRALRHLARRHQVGHVDDPGMGGQPGEHAVAGGDEAV
jgi:hypothetical protein